MTTPEDCQVASESVQVIENENLVESELIKLTDFKYVNTRVKFDEQEALLKLLNSYRNTFAKDLMELVCTTMIEMNIDEMVNRVSVVNKPYKSFRMERDAIAEIEKKWKQAGIATETLSSHTSPVLLLNLKGKKRLLVYYR